MADKNTSLSITIRTVDQATAGIKAINAQLDKVTKPARDLKKAFEDLSKKSGLDDVIGGLKGVGAAFGELLTKVAMIGGVVGVGVAGLVHLVDEFDDLGKSAARLGVGVDFLAEMRDVAERTGVPIEKLQDGLQTFMVNVGGAQTGIGRMVAQLAKVHTDRDHNFGTHLLAQLKGAKDAAAQIDVLADAMARLKDPAARAKLAMMTVGDASLAPMISKGSKAIAGMRDHYLGLAGSQEDATTAAAGTHESMLDLKAATDRVKASLVKGLSPALTEIIDKITVWLTGHQAQIAEWAENFGKRLPKAFDDIRDAIGEAYDKISPFFDSMTKVKVAAVALGAILVGPLLSAIATLGVALLTTPIGWFIASIAALVALFKVLKDHFSTTTAVVGTLAAALGGLFAIGPIKAFIAQIMSAAKAMLGLGEATAATKAAGVAGRGAGAIGALGTIGAVLAVDSMANDISGGSLQDQARAKGWKGEDWELNGALGYLSSGRDDLRPQAGALLRSPLDAQALAALGGRSGSNKFTINVIAPKGTRVTADPSNTDDVDLNTGYQMGH